MGTPKFTTLKTFEIQLSVQGCVLDGIEFYSTTVGQGGKSQSDVAFVREPNMRLVVSFLQELFAKHQNSCYERIQLDIAHQNGLGFQTKCC